MTPCQTVNNCNLFLQHMHWRKQFGTDSILENWKNPAVLEQFWSGGWSGFDKQGSPVWIDPVGTIDMKGMYV